MKRVIIGVRGSDTAMWISKPGKDASSSSDDDMLISPSRYLTQPYMQGRITAPSIDQFGDSNVQVSMVVNHNLGFIPVIEIFGSTQGNLRPAIGNVSTMTLMFNGTIKDNSFSTGGGYFAVDIFYVIFRTRLTSS